MLRQVSFSQNALNPKICLYLNELKARKIALPLNIDLLIYLYQQGDLCSGRAALVGKGLWTEFQPDAEKKKHSDLADWKWIKTTIEKISMWDEDFNSLSDTDKSDFNHYLISLAKYSCKKTSPAPQTQGDWEHFLTNLNGHPVNKIYTIAGYFTAYDLRKDIMLPDPNQPKKTHVTSFIQEIIMHEGNVILVSGDEHDICIFYHNNQFYVHDSLTEEDLFIFNKHQSIELTKMIVKMLGYDSNARLNIGFRVFRFDNQILKITSPGTILKAIYPRQISFEPTPMNNFTNPIHMASFIGCEASLKYHLARHAPVHQRSSLHDATALDYALFMHRHPIAKILLRHGAKINDLSSTDESALYHEAIENNKENVRFLLSNGADPAFIMEKQDKINDIKSNQEIFDLIKTAYQKKQAALAQNTNGLFSNNNNHNHLNNPSKTTPAFSVGKSN